MTQVHEHYNLTPFITDYVLSRNKEGRNVVISVLKASFDFDKRGTMSISPRERMLPIMTTDQLYDNAENASVRYPSDITTEKEGTDIIINGHAYGNNQKKVQCGFSLDHLKKMLIVSGHRVWNQILSFHKITGPFEFDKIPLTYENAFGGSYEDKKGVHHYEYNPVGKGFGAKHLKRPLLPNIEYKDCLIKLISHQPRPAGLGAIPMSWKQRRVLAGTFDETWKTQRFPLAPLDENPRFYNTVPEDQIFRPKLKGLEKLTLINLHRSNSEFKLKIPKHTFTCTARIKEETISQPMEIDTCLIEPDEHRLTLTYVSRIPLYSDTKYLKSVHFEEV